MKSVSIVIPCECTLDQLKRCVRSIRTYTKVPYELILVDRGTDPRFLAFSLEERLVWIKGGTTGPNLNDGLRIASCDALMILGGDRMVAKYWMTHMLNTLYSARNIGIAGPWTSGIGLKTASVMTYEEFEPVAEANGREYQGEAAEVKSVQSGCFLMKREVWERIGKLKPASSGLFDAADYCLRSRAAGFRTVMCRDTLVYNQARCGIDTVSEENGQWTFAGKRRANP